MRGSRRCAFAEQEMEQRWQEEERHRHARDLAPHREAPERLERLVVGEEHRSITDRRRVAAERDGAAGARDGGGHVALEEAPAIEDVERVLATYAEGDRQRDEVE